QEGTASVERELDDAMRSRAVRGSVMHAEAVTLLFSTDSTRAAARDPVELMLDSTTGYLLVDRPRLRRPPPPATPPEACVGTGDPRYREVGEHMVGALADSLPNLAALRRTDVVFADQDAFLIERILLAAGTFGDSASVHRARGALDALLRRTYAHGW